MLHCTRKPKRHVDRLSRCVTIGRIYVRSRAMRPKNYCNTAILTTLACLISDLWPRYTAAVKLDTSGTSDRGHRAGYRYSCRDRELNDVQQCLAAPCNANSCATVGYMTVRMSRPLLNIVRIATVAARMVRC